MISCKDLFCASLLIALSSTGAWAAEDTFSFTSAPDVAAAASAPKDTVVQYVSQHGDFEEMILQFNKTPQSEIHDKWTDYIIMLQGTGTITIGGTVTGKKQTDPGEWRGDGIKEGKSYPLAPGALITIPAGTPHWLQMDGGTPLRMIVVKKPD